MRKGLMFVISVCTLMTMMFAGCTGKNGNKEGQDGDSILTDSLENSVGVLEHLNMAYYDFDKVDNLSQFFDSIGRIHEIPLREMGDDEEPVDRVRKCIKAIDRYRKGEAKYYPDSMVMSAISEMGLEAAYLMNHGAEFNLVYDEWLLMCMAYYSPDITYLVDMQTPDHKAGILNFGQSYNDSPWWAYLILKREKGYEVICLGDDSKFTGIFPLEDEKHRRYYLCSNNDGALMFRQELFWLKGEGDVAKVASCSDIQHDETVDFDDYYFDRKRLQWFYSKWDKKRERKISVSDVPLLTLKLDGDHSQFVQER